MIPKIIHYCWLSDEEYPTKIQKCIDSWKSILPDYEIRLWNLSNFDILSTNWTKQAFENKKYAFASDYIRFYALYLYGGIYLDSDVEVLKPFDDLLSLDFFCGYEFEGLPEAAIVGSAKGQDWALNCMRWYQEHNFINDDGTFNIKVAPVVLQNMLEMSLHNQLIDRGEIMNYRHNSYAIYPYDYFSPKNSFNGEICTTVNSYCIHHFNAEWGKKGIKVQIKKKIHLLLIRLLGKDKYILFIYKVRKKIRSL